jgi:hypothetical protein
MRVFRVSGNFVCCWCCRFLEWGHTGPHLGPEDQPK